MKKRSRIVVLSIPAIIVLTGLFAYNSVYLGLQEKLKEAKEARMVKTKTLERYLAIAAELPAEEGRLQELKERRKAVESRFLDGRTPALCAAALQDTVKGVITGRGGSISSERVEKPEDNPAFRVISINVDAGLPDAKALSDVLYEIETRTPPLVVRELDIRVKNFREPRDLIVKLKVSGLMAAK